ncbi:hypothetical protein WR25_11012 [Diploscapter pachys]|uniref:Uncharacterized protein n=1 Tax=Diploscapter pachys TaxID=2018661 RepID=A0A2A2K372_9BILA|nr:hypothetical protein WR25_11012 [Diploscapter pachys]
MPTDALQLFKRLKYSGIARSRHSFGGNSTEIIFSGSQRLPAPTPVHQQQHQFANRPSSESIQRLVQTPSISNANALPQQAPSNQTPMTQNRGRRRAAPGVKKDHVARSSSQSMNKGDMAGAALQVSEEKLRRTFSKMIKKLEKKLKKKRKQKAKGKKKPETSSSDSSSSSSDSDSDYSESDDEKPGKRNKTIRID